MLRRGDERADILRTVDIDGATLDRLTRALAEHPDAHQQTTEEILLQAVVDGTDRPALVAVLGGLEYDDDPATYRWDDVVGAVAEGLLLNNEFVEVQTMRRADRRAAREGWSSSIRTATEMQRALADDDRAWLLQSVVEARTHVGQIIREAPELAPAWRAAPAPVDDRWDVLLAAVIGREFTTAGLAVPAWTESRVIDSDWVHPCADLSEAEVRTHTPAWLAERHIFICHRDLA